MSKVDLENEICIVSKATIDSFLKQDKPADLIALYLFYYYTAKWQGTNQPRVTIPYVCKGLGWGHNRVRDTKRKLVSMGLIEDVRRTDEHGKTTGWFIRIKYFWSRKTEANIHPTYNGEGGLCKSNNHNKNSTLPKNHRVDFREVNALNDNNKNALSDNIPGKTSHRQKSSQSVKERENTAVRIYEYYAEHIRAGARADAIKSIKKLLKAGENETTLIGYIDNYLRAMPEDKTYRVQAHNFFGRAARYQDYQQTCSNEVPRSVSKLEYLT